jgi:hypothetical protein
MNFIQLFGILVLIFPNVSFCSVAEQLDSLIIDREHLVQTFHQLIRIFKSNPTEEDRIERFLHKKYYPKIREYYRSNQEELIRIALKNHIYFQIMIVWLRILKKIPNFFSNLMAVCERITNGLKGVIEEKALEDLENTKKTSHLVAFMFTHLPIELLLFSPIVFRDDWEVRMGKIKLFLELMRNVIAFFRPSKEFEFYNSDYTICQTTVSIEFSNLEYILERFSISKKGKINFNELELVYKQLTTRELKEKDETVKEEKIPPPKEQPNVKSLCNIYQRWLYRFRLNSSHFFSSKYTLPEDLSKFKDPKFFCLAAIAAYKKDGLTFKDLKERFQFKLEILIEEAIDILEKQIKTELELFSSNMTSINNLFKRESNQKPSSGINSFLRNYVDGAFDMNKLKIKTYLNLLRIKSSSLNVIK